MPIGDLIPWRRKKNKTKVPVRVEERPVRAADRDAPRRTDALSRWFDLAPFGAFGGWAHVFGPRMDMVEDSQGFTVTIEVPGMDKDDIDVTLSQGRLTVRGEKREEKEHRGRYSYHARSMQQAFRRSILLPCQINAGEVEAALSRGVLTISLPKVEAGRGHRRIPIRSR